MAALANVMPKKAASENREKEFQLNRMKGSWVNEKNKNKNNRFIVWVWFSFVKSVNLLLPSNLQASFISKSAPQTCSQKFVVLNFEAPSFKLAACLDGCFEGLWHTGTSCNALRVFFWSSEMDLQLRGKTALVTGASVGLGRCMAQMLAREGCELAIVARRDALLNSLAEEIQAEGGAKPLVIVCDIMEKEAAQQIHEQVMQRFGGLDILVNNAGGSRPFAGMGTREQWDDAMNLNFHAGREITHAFLPEMQQRGFGRIINLTGPDEPMIMNGGVPPNGAVHVWAKALSRHVGAQGITVNSIAPGRLHSEQVDEKLLPTPQAQQAWVAANVPAGYIGEPEDLAALVCFLVSPLARYITGQVIHVDGGARRAAS